MASTANATSVLTNKIANALYNRGYSEDIIQKVTGLVERNTIRKSSRINETALKQDEIDSQTATVLDSLLKEFSVNSNEPVLLINAKGIHLQRELFGATLNHLHNVHHIWPVRVYAGNFLDLEEEEWEVALLNVVNTEIGGPNMVQLLDDEDARDQTWESLAIVEVWRDRQFVSREEKNQSRWSAEARELDEGREVAQEAAAVPLPDETGDRKLEEVAATAGVPSDTELLPSLPEVTEGARENRVAPDDGTQDAQLSRQHPDMLALMEAEASRPSMRYPSWDRSHDAQTLGDLVRTQSFNIAGNEDEKENLDPDASVNNDGLKDVVRPQIEGDAEEGFEIV